MLSRHLVGETDERLAQIAPNGLPALVTMFPVLTRIAWPTSDFDQDELLTDPQSLVRQALGALRQLLRQIAVGRPLVLWIDDLQWSDAGSLPILAEIVASGDTPILTIFSYKSEDVGRDSILAALAFGESAQPDIEIRHIEMGPLDAASVASLVDALSGGPALRDRDQASGRHAPERRAADLCDAARAPRLLREHADVADPVPAGTSGGNFLAERIRSLTAAQRAVLEIVAAARTSAGRRDAAARRGPRSCDGPGNLSASQPEFAAQGGRQREGPAVETYHDRIRAAALEALDRGDAARSGTARSPRR